MFRLARTIDDRADAGDSGAPRAGGDAAEDPSADSTTDPELQAAPERGPGHGRRSAYPGSGRPPRRPPRPSAARASCAAAPLSASWNGSPCAWRSSAGQPVAIAYVVAIKGLGRFAELKATPVAAERFIIGTLTSMLWAAGVAALAKVLFLG